MKIVKHRKRYHKRTVIKITSDTLGIWGLIIDALILLSIWVTVPLYK